MKSLSRLLYQLNRCVVHAPKDSLVSPSTFLRSCSVFQFSIWTRKFFFSKTSKYFYKDHNSRVQLNIYLHVYMYTILHVRVYICTYKYTTAINNLFHSVYIYRIIIFYYRTKSALFHKFKSIVRFTASYCFPFILFIFSCVYVCVPTVYACLKYASWKIVSFAIRISPCNISTTKFELR